MLMLMLMLMLNQQPMVGRVLKRSPKWAAASNLSLNRWADHVDYMFKVRVQSLFVMQTLRQHGLINCFMPQSLPGCHMLRRPGGVCQRRRHLVRLGCSAVWSPTQQTTFKLRVSLFISFFQCVCLFVCLLSYQRSVWYTIKLSTSTTTNYQNYNS